jgi:hypothetical protein
MPNSESASDVFSLATIQIAIERCCLVNPPAGAELRLHPDANLLGDILGEMFFRKLNSIPLRFVQGEHLAALKRWMQV